MKVYTHHAGANGSRWIWRVRLFRNAMLVFSQHRAARFVLGQPWRRHQRDSITDMLSTLKWPALQLTGRRWARLTALLAI